MAVTRPVRPDHAPAAVARLLEERRYDEAAAVLAGSFAAGLEDALRDQVRAALELAAPPDVAPAGPASAAAATHATRPSGAADPRVPVPAPAPPEPLLAVHCLGPFRVYHEDRCLGPWPSRRAKSLLKFLVLHRDGPVPKEVLMDRFWPDAAPAAARNCLNVAVHGLRRFLRDAGLDGGLVRFEEGCYLLGDEAGVWVDVEEFRRLAASAARREREGDVAGAIHDLEAAESLHRGALFEDDPYEEWTLPHQREVADAHVQVLDRLRTHHVDAGDDAAAASACRRLLAVEPWREDVHVELMHCYERQGQPCLALRQYHECREALRAELDTVPSDMTAELHERIRIHAV